MTNNERHINLLHPKARPIFRNFIEDCEKSGYKIYIYSSLRSIASQQYLYRRWLNDKENNIQAAMPGYSFHNYGFAIDIKVWDRKKGIWTENYEILKKVSIIAKKYGIFWLGKQKKNEAHHFDLGGFKNRNRRIAELRKLWNERKVDEDGYVLIDEIEDEVFKKIEEKWQIEIGKNYLEQDEVLENDEPKKIKKQIITNIKKQKAVGIWQIVKLFADQYSLSQTINDASIAFNQGSLLNFVRKVVQEPWLQFYGDTYGKNYFFIVRKEPFDFNGWINIPYEKTLYDEDVFGDELSWYDGDIYSWYQVIPKGAFLGQQNLIYAYVSAVFFEEIAEIWGSKPKSQVSNYLNFVKTKHKKSLYEKAVEDLRYLVESNVYLPFTRQGSITVRGDFSIKIGMKIFYTPTQEVFYVDGVSHNYQNIENGVELMTTIRVSRGMKKRFTMFPTSRNDVSYWNIVDFNNEIEEDKIIEKEIKEDASFFFFDNLKSHFIKLDERFDKNNASDLKMIKTIELYPNLREKLLKENQKSIEQSIKIINRNKEAKEFVVTGFTDSDFHTLNKTLIKNRAKTIKTTIIDKYLEIYNDYTRQELEKKIKIEFYEGNIAETQFKTIIENSKKNEDEKNLLKKTYQRNGIFFMKPYKKKEKKKVKRKGVAWKINRPVFEFFLNKRQCDE